jgi:hypothetical protein
MSNYTKSTDFASKDTLPSGDSAKIVRGTEIDVEFEALETAISSKADLTSPTFTGTPAAPTAVSGTNTSQIATTAFVTTALQAIYPIGSVYINSSVATNPNTLLGFGTWTAFGAGRVLVGFDSGNTLFDTAEETGGSADAVVVSHTHTVTDAGHSHTIPSNPSDTGSGTSLNEDSSAGETVTTNSATTGISINSSGVSGTNANYQPYITVYMWKRTA